VTDYQRIKNAIESTLNTFKRSFIIYPYGEYGMLTKQILNDSFGIKEKYIIDNKLFFTETVCARGMTYGKV